LAWYPFGALSFGWQSIQQWCYETMSF